MSAPTEYLPSDFMDEVCPAHRSHPNDWIAVRETGAAVLAETVEDVASGDDGPTLRVEVGATVSFATQIARGEIEIKLLRGGKWELGDGAVPQEWTRVCTRMIEGGCVAGRDVDGPMGLAVTDLITQLQEELIFEDGEEEGTVTAYFYTDGEEKWRLIDQGGVLTFVAQGAVH